MRDGAWIFAHTTILGAVVRRMMMHGPDWCNLPTCSRQIIRIIAEMDVREMSVKVGFNNIQNAKTKNPSGLYPSGHLVSIL